MKSEFLNIIMKKLKYIGIIFLLGTYLSCSNNEELTQEQEAQVASGVADERLKLLNNMKSSLWALNDELDLTE